MTDASTPSGAPFVLPGSEADGGDTAFDDEEAASRARARYRTGIPVVEPDAMLAPHLSHDETVFDYRALATVSAIDGATSSAPKAGGVLFVTDQRLIHVGEQTTSVHLSDVIELTVTDSTLLINLANSSGLVVELRQPRRLRVLLLAAKAAGRGTPSDASESS